MKHPEEYLKKAHDACFENKKQILQSDQVGCFYCKRIYPAKDVVEEDYVQDKNDGTAMCPHCDIDSVIGDASGYNITTDFLEDMHEMWFMRTTTLEEFKKKFNL